MKLNTTVFSVIQGNEVTHVQRKQINSLNYINIAHIIPRAQPYQIVINRVRIVI